MNECMIDIFSYYWFFNDVYKSFFDSVYD